MGVAAPVMMGIGTVMNMGSSMMQGRAAARAAEAEARLAKAQAQRTAAAMRKDSKRKLADMRLVVAKSGVELEGSPLARIIDNAYEMELDALDVETYGEAASKQALARASAYRTGGIMSAFGAGLSGGAMTAAMGSSMMGGSAAEATT